MRDCRTIFITGTDTGVGKTVLTSLLLARLRAKGCKALAVKPFCSGSRADAVLLRLLQDRVLLLQEINPFYSKEPVAPLVSARKRQHVVTLAVVVDQIQALASRCECLLIEGAGGLLVPLGEGYTALDLITRLHTEVIVVTRNRLGTLNHTMLTVGALRNAGVHDVRVVMMELRACDFSVRSNPRILSELLEPTPLFLFPFLGTKVKRSAVLCRAASRHSALLDRVLA
jgi:dethiobiotin synthetase